MFIYCDTFLIDVHVCFDTHCNVSYETLTMIHKGHMSVMFCLSFMLNVFVNGKSLYPDKLTHTYVYP